MIKICFLILFFTAPLLNAQVVRVGTKNFVEGYILGEIIAQILEGHESIHVERKFGLGGTGIVYQALINDEIDLYIDYSGTLSESILKKANLKDLNDLRLELERKEGLTISEPLGFNNTYALAIRKQFAIENGLTTISDLSKIKTNPKYAFTYEFMSRADGFNGLVKAYNLPLKKSAVKSMEHSLLYTAIENKSADIIEVYSTDAKIKTLDLVVLEDDKGFFPEYEALIVTSQKFAKRYPQIWSALKSKLEGTISEEEMRTLNEYADIEKISVPNVVKKYFNTETDEDSSDLQSRILKRTKEHLVLVGISLLFAIVFGIPLGILADRSRVLGHSILFLSGIVQTIPSLALLCFLIPVFGIGIKPALIALFLYSLFPIIVNTFTGLRTIDPSYIESAHSLGLTSFEKLVYIQLPLVSPYILSGVKTSAIISIGTATLAALIGAGGYGAPIVSGLALNDNATILIGAIPAAIMALAMHLIFDLLKFLVIPKGLRTSK